METKQQDITILYLRGIPKSVKMQFKAWAATQGVSMTQAVVDLMRGAINKGKPTK